MQQQQTLGQQTQPQQAQQQQTPQQSSPNQIQPRVQIPPIHILLLGRYNFDGYKLEQTDLFTYRGKGAGRQIISKKYPFLKITFMTAHASKGLGYDEVIVINGQGGTYGFPSQIEDDPILSLVLREDRSYAYAEERRLFYVAMTRTKNRVYFIAPLQEPSEFLQELLRDYKNVRLDPFGNAEHQTEKDLNRVSGKNEEQKKSGTASGRTKASEMETEDAETELKKTVSHTKAAETEMKTVSHTEAAEMETEAAKTEMKESISAAETAEKERFLQQSSSGTGLSSGKKICPICGYPLQLRYKVSYGLRLYLCTNDSEICGFMTNNLRGGRLSIIKCDRCADGYLIVRTRRNSGEPFLGCTNYTRDQKGCRRTMGWPEYHQKMRYEAQIKNTVETKK
ncbi:MAG: 3'-5' exonuclease [Eubacteriales bacterium]|nr:3'-5' exonuclease [Eubacteriales bacterium]